MTAEKPPTTPRIRPRNVAQMNAALRASGIDYQVEGDEVDIRAFTKAIARRFPKIMAKLAD